MDGSKVTSKVTVHPPSFANQTRKVRVTLENRIPSWKKYGKGHAIFEIYGNTLGRWLDLNMVEYGCDYDGSGSSRKETMMNIDGKDAAGIFEVIGEVLGVSKETLAKALAEAKGNPDAGR